MDNQDSLNYERIATAIAYIRDHFKEQPDLDTIAEKVHLSPFHFQRLFSEWAGTSPKKFLQYISLEHARKVLKEQQVSLAEAAFETGLSGTGRLHELFVKIEGMTPAEYKSGGKNLEIHYSYGVSPFGRLLIASTGKGICHVAFTSDDAGGLAILQSHFPNARFLHQDEAIHRQLQQVFTHNPWPGPLLKLHLKGTDFQLKVWEALLRIPLGQLSTYGNLAAEIEKPAASRAVGTAIGSNPVAFLIPCHRVIQASGALGGYMWGPVRKTAIIGWEAASADTPDKPNDPEERMQSPKP